jgi:hypothetical protein
MHYLEVGGATASLSGPTVPPLPPAPNAPGSPTAASGGQTAHGIEDGGRTTTLGGQTALPFTAPSLPASPTLAVPHAAPMTSVAAHATLLTPTLTLAAPPVALVSQHYSCHPRAAREPSAPPLHQQSPLVKAVPVAPLINPHLMTVREKRGFWLPADKITLSVTSSSPLSLEPTSVRATLIDMS